MLTNEFIKEYKEMEGEAEQKYQAQQALIAAFAADQGTSVPSVRASLVKLNIYENKPKTTKVYKSDLVDQLVAKLKLDITDSEDEYLNRLTVSLIRKILKAVS